MVSRHGMPSTCWRRSNGNGAQAGHLQGCASSRPYSLVHLSVVRPIDQQHGRHEAAYRLVRLLLDAREDPRLAIVRELAAKVEEMLEQHGLHTMQRARLARLAS